MFKLYQNEWFGITFKNYYKLKKKKIADDIFYKNFYQIFYKKYFNFKMLPKTFQYNKKIIYSQIKKIINKNKKNYYILSIGAGCGYIENFLSKKNNITVYENHKENIRWLSENKKIKIISGNFKNFTSKKLKNFDLVFASNIDYIFTDKQYINFINKLFDLNVKDFLLTDIILHEQKTYHHLKLLIKIILRKIKLKNNEIFFGYLRTKNEHISLIKKTKYKKIDYGILLNKRMWIRLKI